MSMDVAIIKKIDELTNIARLGVLGFPKYANWDVFKIKPSTNLTLKAGEEKLIVTDKDLKPYKHGWVWSGLLTSNSPYAGIRLRYKTPRATVQEITGWIEQIKKYGWVTPVPGRLTVDVYGASTQPEYVMSIPPSWLIPFHGEFTGYLINKGTTSITIYEAILILIMVD